MACLRVVHQTTNLSLPTVCLAGEHSFFVLLAVYFIAGVLFMKYKMNANGREMVPNVEFWASLPGTPSLSVRLLI